MFNKDLKIGAGEKYDATQVSNDGVNLEEVAKKNKKLIDIFKAFDLNADNKLDDLELAKAMDAFSKLDDGNGKLSKKELDEGAKMFNEMTNLDVKGKDLKSFIKSVAKLTKGDTKVNVSGLLEQEANLAKMKDVPPPAQEEVKLTVKDELPVVKKDETPETFSYTVQNGESYNGLIKRILKAKGIDNPTKEDIANAKAEFEKNNPDAVKKNSKGVEFLNVGAKIKIGADLGDKDNASEQVGKYADDAAKRDEIKKENAKYSVDAFYRNKDGSEGRHLKLKATGEKAENGRYYAVDKQGNKYLVAHDGTVLDAAKVAKKDAAVTNAKEKSATVNTLISQFNTAKKSFDNQVQKDGWAANTADAVSGFFGSTNTEDNVRADMNEYKQQLKGLKEALMTGDDAKFKAKFKEVYGLEYNAAAVKDYQANPTAENYQKAFGTKQDIGMRVAKYNESQETGAKVVKGVTVGVVAGAAAVATGGASLLVTAAVAGGSTFVASTAAETIDLATNDIDGDVNAENMANITKQAATEAAFATVTAGLVKGAGSMLSKGGGAVAKSSATVVDDAANAGQKALPNLVTGTVDDAANAGQKALPNLVTGTVDDAANAGQKAITGVSNVADDAAGAGAKAGTKAGTGTAGAADDVAGAGAKAGASKAASVNKEVLNEALTKLDKGRTLSSAEKLEIEKIFGMKYDNLMKIKNADYKKLVQQVHPDRAPEMADISSTLMEMVQYFKKTSIAQGTFRL